MRRRNFLKLAAATPVVSLAGPVPAILHAAARGADAQQDRVLVVVQLSGGNDGLNTVIPFAHDEYARSRPTLRIEENAVVRIDHDEIGLHPALSGLAKMVMDGDATIVQGVGYPEPNRSHFESMDLWHTAHGTGTLRSTGWLGRWDKSWLVDPAAPACVHIGAEVLPRALWSRATIPVSLRSLESMQLPQRERFGNQLMGLLGDDSAYAGSEMLQRIAAQSRAAVQTSDAISAAARDSDRAGEYPGGGLGERLHAVARLIDSGFPARVYYVALEGFDTHASQLSAHHALLDQLSRSVVAFSHDLRQEGCWDRTQVLVFSEFGRRLRENASRGTDHGAAGPVFLLGGGSRKPIIGTHPSLRALDEAGDLKFAIDYRRIYATLLEDWLNVASEPILGGHFEKLV